MKPPCFVSDLPEQLKLLKLQVHLTMPFTR